MAETKTIRILATEKIQAMCPFEEEDNTDVGNESGIDVSEDLSRLSVAGASTHTNNEGMWWLRRRNKLSYLQTGRNRAPVVEERDADKSTSSSVDGLPSASSLSGPSPLSPPKVRPQTSSRLADLPVPPPPTVETILQFTSTSMTPSFHWTQLWVYALISSQFDTDARALVYQYGAKNNVKVEFDPQQTGADHAPGWLIKCISEHSLLFTAYYTWLLMRLTKLDQANEGKVIRSRKSQPKSKLRGTLSKS